MRAVGKLALLCAMAVALLSLFARPWAYARTYALEQQSISRFDLSNIRAGTFTDVGNGGYVLYAREVDVNADEMRGVFVQVEREQRSQVISAERARIHGVDEEGSRAVEFFVDAPAPLVQRIARRHQRQHTHRRVCQAVPR